MKNGSDVRTFEYNIVEFNKGGYVVDTYTETYVFNPERDIPILTNHCEEFIRFLEENRALITDTKIFGNGWYTTWKMNTKYPSLRSM